MNATTTNDLIEAITDLRTLFPEWRFGQLIANLAISAGRDEAGGVWDVEDEQLLAAARRLIERNSERRKYQI